MSTKKRKPSINETFYGVALRFKETMPAVAEALPWSRRDSFSSFGSYRGRFKDLFSLMAKSDESIKDEGAAGLWFFVMNTLQRQGEDFTKDEQDACNLFLGPAVEALTLHIDNDDPGLESSDLARLSHAAVKAPSDVKWLTSENCTKMRDLAAAASRGWVRAYNKKSAGPANSAG